MRQVMKWDYRTKEGQAVGRVVRFEDDPGPGNPMPRKQIVPFFHQSGQSGIPKDLPSERRIFGLETVRNSSEPLFIVEGEKCAFALHGLGLQAVTSVGGCGQVDLADWSTLSGSERIYILPDHDRPGTKYAEHVYHHVRHLKSVKEIWLVRFPMHESADVCDFLQSLGELDGWNGFESLTVHPLRETVRERLDAYIAERTEPPPSAWHFLVTKHKYKLIDVNDFSRMKLPKRETILSPWLTEGSINMVFADRGIGKTFFCLSCAVALANGDSFLAYQAPAPVPVLYLDGEMQAISMQERLKKLTKGERTKAPLLIFTPDCQDLTDHIPDIGLTNGRLEIDELVRTVNPKVVFIDNISTFVRTGNENEGDSWAPVQEWAVQLRKRGIAVVFIHHANKEGKQRGSHKKEDVMDVVIQLKRPDDFIQGSDDTRMLVRFTKSRHLSAVETREIEATLKTIDGTLHWAWEAGDLACQRATELHRDGFSMAEIAEELSVSKSTVHRWIKKTNEQTTLQH